MSLSYESSGVRYDQLDAFKRACQKAARTTADLLTSHGYAEPATTRGESAYLIEAADHYLAHVEEGPGHEEPRGRRRLRRHWEEFLPRDRHRYGRHDRQRPRHVRGAADLGRDARGGGRLGLVYRCEAHAGARGRLGRRLPDVRRGLGWRRNADPQGHRATRDNRAGRFRHRQNCAEAAAHHGRCPRR